VPITEHPLRRCGRADLPHPAPTSGDDAKSAERIGMTETSRRQPLIDMPLHSCPGEAMALAGPTKRAHTSAQACPASMAGCTGSSGSPEAPPLG
jgi:hypothetical protein